MAEIRMMSGNEAVARGALAAGCTAYFGYPITPQSDILEYMGAVLPTIPGGVFIQTEDELGAAGMVNAAAACGRRAMSSTSTPGYALMQEWISSIAGSRHPAVIVDVARNAFPTGGGSSWGNQGDYRVTTRGGAGGGYRQIVIAPWSAQDCYELIQLAFHLADKHLMPVIVLSAGVIGEGVEPVELKSLEFGPLPSKDEWTLKSRGQRGGKPRKPVMDMFRAGPPGTSMTRDIIMPLYQKVAEDESRWESYGPEKADLLVVAYGYVARIALDAMDMAKAKGIKVRMIRPVTLWPFPSKAIEEAALKAGRALVCEDSIPEMAEDVEAAVKGKVPVHALGNWARHLPSGMWYPERILEEIEAVLKPKAAKA